MKWDATEPTEGTFTFTQADAEVAFAQANNMHVRGHTLVWHNQIPAWVFNHADGTPLTNSPDDQALLTQRLQNHITALMTHFGNAVPIWDVVNEPIDESQPDGYRRSPWFNILGPAVHPDRAAGRARRQPDGQALHQRVQHDDPGQARLPGRPGAAA